MPDSNAAVFALASTLHQQGRFREAIELLQTIPPGAPQRVDAAHMIGAALLQLGKPQEAEQHIAETIAARPDDAAAQFNLGLLQQNRNELDAAVATFERALALKPDYPEAHLQIGIIRERQKRPAEALRCYEAAIRLRPHYAEASINLASPLTTLNRNAAERVITLNPQLVAAHLNRGAAFYQLGRIEESIASYQRAIALSPNLPAAHFNLGLAYQERERWREAAGAYVKCTALDPNNFQAWHRLGGALHLADRYEEAVAASEQAIRLDPRSAETFANLGSTLQQLHRHAEAEEKYRAAIALAPDLAPARANLASVLRLLSRVDEALAAAEKSLALDPKLAVGELNLANVLEDLDRHEEALPHYDAALSLNPKLGDARRHKALLLLYLRNFSEGWDLNESRWELINKNLFPRYFSHPDWQGNVLPDGDLLAWGEQGLGDQILNASMVGELARRARTVVVEVEARLVPLFARSFPALKVRAIDSNEFVQRFTAQVAFSSLGRFFRRSIGAFPNRPQGYLKADPERVLQLRARLRRPGVPLIGLSWISKNPGTGTLKTSRLIDFESVLQMEGCRFIDLQYGDTADERAEVERTLGITVERLDDIDNMTDIDALAALVCACDAVVTVSNTTAHLGGALGVETWVAVPAAPARPWHWFKDGERSLWYPRVRLHRKRRGEPWSELIAAMAPDIAAFVAKRKRSATAAKRK